MASPRLYLCGKAASGHEQYDLYVNLFQPSPKLISKERHGSRVRRSHDTAKTLLERALEAGNPIKLHQHVEQLSVRSLSLQIPKTPLEKKCVTTGWQKNYPLNRLCWGTSPTSLPPRGEGMYSRYLVRHQLLGLSGKVLNEWSVLFG